MRREVPLIITGIVGIVLVVVHFIPHAPFNELKDVFSEWFFIISAFAIVLGVGNLLKVSLDKVYKKQKGWFFGLITVLGFFLIVIPGFLFSGGRTFDTPGTPFFDIYFYVYIPLMATMFALLAFFVASAAYRAFRARNKEAAMLLVAASLVMLGRSALFPPELKLGPIADWVMDFPQTAGQRAIMIGIALGTISTSLRVILGIERTYIGGE